jgi:carbamoyl-phosphate synthase large subunit
MPKRTDIKTVLVIGSGPIVIGQACEFDYSGTQGVRALRQEGYRVVLVNSNPATIMTDPELAERTYVEPLTPGVLEQVIAAERPEALLPTLGGQTALNLALELHRRGVLDKYGVEMIGADVKAIEKAEDREKFKAAMARIGLAVPTSGYARTVQEARAILAQIGLPAVIRPSFTLGGVGGGIVFSEKEFDDKVAWGIAQSPRGEILVEQSVLGWKEYELEVMRDSKDNVVIICSIENLDPMGVHTGDSITIAPAMTLTDKEYQRLRDASLAIIREIGVATGGSNIQFAVDPATGKMIVIEMNPRVSRSSALASKATGFPIAKIAAKLAVGFTLDEIPNDITKTTPACFEPTIDYVVVKIPRFAFEKFPGADATLTTQMKSVGEVMAMGRTFREAFGKALRSLEIGRAGLDLPLESVTTDALKELITTPTAERIFQVAEALRRGCSVEEVHALTYIDPWFLAEMAEIIAMEEQVATHGEATLRDAALLLDAKRTGLGDQRIAKLLGTTEQRVREARKQLGVVPSFKRVDTCAAEFEAHTPYMYSSYETECEAAPTDRRKVIILGGGPNRIGQGIEFDYCCVHGVMALREEGFEALMINCNPETVSTDYDTSDRLYFEPLTLEDVLAIVDREKPAGVIVQFGGQTPLKLAVALERAGVKLLGTSADSIDRAEDRQRFGEVLDKLGLKAPAWGTARSLDEALQVAVKIGFPVMVRPSYVLGGRAMEIVNDEQELREMAAKAFAVSPEHPILIDQFLRDAVEVDVDAVADGHDVVVGGVMEHIEEAGIHSGDSACGLPPYSLAPHVVEELASRVRALARELGVVGLMNAQLAVQGQDIYVIEVNPRASRTVPFVSKTIGVPLAKIAARVMVGRTVAELGVREVRPSHVAVKEAVFPFARFPGVDTLLGPEMRSTGEVMGIAADFPTAFAKAQLAAGNAVPDHGTAFVSVRDADKPAILEVARRLRLLGFSLLATRGTASYLTNHGLDCEHINKVYEGSPHCVDRMVADTVQLVINTAEGPVERRDSFSLRRTALTRSISYFTTVAGARAAVAAIEARRSGTMGVRPLQDYHF